VTRDTRWMELALQRAHLAVGRTAPNPSVGAVLVRDGVVIGSGFTQPVGGPHAEIEALSAAVAAGHDPRGATMYATLEPCCHHGRTAPCTDALIEAGVARVVVGTLDSFPAMQGKGLARLRGVGIAVELGVCAQACERLVRGFTRSLDHGLPEVTCKVATSLDGRIATVDGQSQWITGDLARADGHRLRARHDAILVGIGTALADDPRLTCRVMQGVDPVPVVLDTELRLPTDAKLLTGARAAVVICADDAPERRLSADIVRVPRSSVGSGVDIGAALSVLAGRGLHRVLVEGGGQVHRSLLDARLVDTLHVYVGSVVVPGGLPWLAGPPLGNLDDALRLGAPEVTSLGDDVRLTYQLAHRLSS
jgi:diaminohydroxyphosphoribosylaminopyrimidine deaminase/5-amino-6-(5-phosphoribosylamino)uracil reductase